jgi:pyrroline-5-carboxylate reductase
MSEITLDGIGPVVLVGAGKMGLALARGWLRGGLAGADLVMNDPQPGEAATTLAAESGARLLPAPPHEVARVVVLAVKPQVMGAVLPTLRPLIGPHTLVISIAAGVAMATLSAGLGTRRVIRTMPNTPAQIGQGISGAVAAADADAADRGIASALLGAAGEVVWVDDERAIDGITAVSGSGPAYVFNFVEALAAAAVEQGFASDAAMQLARQTVIGAAALMAADPTPVGTLRQNVTSPKGTTEAALNVLMAPDGLAPLVARAVEAARRRSEELGK